MLSVNIITGLEPTSFLKNELLHMFSSRIFSTVMKNPWVAAFVFSSTLELSAYDYKESCNIFHNISSWERESKEEKNMDLNNKIKHYGKLWNVKKNKEMEFNRSKRPTSNQRQPKLEVEINHVFLEYYMPFDAVTNLNFQSLIISMY